MLKKILCSTLLGSISCLAHSTTLFVEGITFTGGTVTLTDPGGAALTPTLILTPGTASTVNDNIPNGVIDADGEHGSSENPVLGTVYLNKSITGFFAHSAQTCSANCSSMITLLDPDPDAISMNGTPWDPSISADFSGFFMDFNGNKMLQGGTATGTGSWIDIPTAEGGPGLYSFELSWSALFQQGPFQGFTGNWTVTGTAVTAVPEPQGYALILTGLGLVGAAARRRVKRSTT